MFTLFLGSLFLFTNLAIAIGHRKPYLGPKSRKEEFIEFAVKQLLGGTLFFLATRRNYKMNEKQAVGREEEEPSSVTGQGSYTIPGTQT